MKVISFLSIAIMIALCSCSSLESKPSHPVVSTVKILVLENGTTSFVRIPNYLSSVYGFGDTVWVALDKHVIDDTSNTTMKCVIQPPVVYQYCLNISGGVDSNNIYTVYDNFNHDIGTVKANRLDSLINADNE